LICESLRNETLDNEALMGDLLFYVAVSLMLLHEMDAIDKKE